MISPVVPTAPRTSVSRRCSAPSAGPPRDEKRGSRRLRKASPRGTRARAKGNSSLFAWYGPRVLYGERIWVSMAALVCLTLVFSMRDSGPKYPLPSRIEPPPVPASITHRPGRVVAIVEAEEGEPVLGASVRLLSLDEDRGYLAGAGTTDAAGRAEPWALPTWDAWSLDVRPALAHASE